MKARETLTIAHALHGAGPAPSIAAQLALTTVDVHGTGHLRQRALPVLADQAQGAVIVRLAFGGRRYTKPTLTDLFGRAVIAGRAADAHNTLLVDTDLTRRTALVAATALGHPLAIAVYAPFIAHTVIVGLTRKTK